MAQPVSLDSPTLVAQAATKRRRPFIIGYNHPTFASGHLLIRIKRKNTDITERSDLPAFVPCSQCFAGVLDDLQIVLLCDPHDGVHVAREAEHVHGEDSPYPPPGPHIRQRAALRVNYTTALNEELNLARIQVESMRINVYE